MSRLHKICTIWSFGLSVDAAAKLGKLLERQFPLRVWPAGAVPSLADFEKDQPCLALFSVAAHQAMQKISEHKSKQLGFIPHVLALDESARPDGTDETDGAGRRESLEYAVDADVSAIIRPSLSRAAIMKKISMVLEMEAVQLDVLRMTREIYLEREILERKNEVLQFLVNFLTKTSSGLDREEILRTTFSCMKLLFPVRSIHAALWKPETAENEGREVDLFLTSEEGSQAFTDWNALMLEQIRSALPGRDFIIQSRRTELQDQESEWRNAGPENGHVLHLPINLGGKQTGFISILTDMDRSLSRDQALALNSALHFLALTLNNANHFQDVKHQADYDALTGVFSRRHFDKRLAEEVEKANRRGQSLSLIFCDIDHFKRINDTLGHQAGDGVLRGVAETISQMVRDQDYTARYGGEEFVVLLPHTTPQQALPLAERLRKAIENRIYPTRAGNVTLTISAGISGAEPQDEKNGSRLIQQADIALYQAKHASRNCSRNYCRLPEDGKKVAI